jgi:hypothetical protein
MHSETQQHPNALGYALRNAATSQCTWIFADASPTRGSWAIGGMASTGALQLRPTFLCWRWRRGEQHYKTENHGNRRHEEFRLLINKTGIFRGIQHNVKQRTIIVAYHFVIFFWDAQCFSSAVFGVSSVYLFPPKKEGRVN